jgi:hypothetical protein
MVTPPFRFRMAHALAGVDGRGTGEGHLRQASEGAAAGGRDQRQQDAARCEFAGSGNVAGTGEFIIPRCSRRGSCCRRGRRADIRRESRKSKPAFALYACCAHDHSAGPAVRRLSTFESDRKTTVALRPRETIATITVTMPRRAETGLMFAAGITHGEEGHGDKGAETYEDGLE